MRHILGILFLILTTGLWSQDLSVPDDILSELETVVVETDSGTFTFRVAYPSDYSPDKTYTCFLGLSGGSQSMEVVNYCYAAWFRSGYFDQHITVLPVAKNEKANFRNYKPKQIEEMLDAIQNHFNVNPQFLIAGTSNGGVGAFNFVAAFPDRFEGIIVAPGMLDENTEPDETWAHLKVILACGELDDPAWIKATKATGKRLKKKVRSLQIISLAEQGHILAISFNADKMYDPYFLPSK